jgi:hypothetical protein
VYNSKWACGNNHMLSHHVRVMLKIYSIRGPLLSYIHLVKAPSRYFKDYSSGHIIISSRSSSILFEIEFSSWVD